MQVAGTLHLVGETKEYGNNGFKKREAVIKTEGEYPQFLSITFVKDKCDLLDKFKAGQKVTVDINLRGREWINPEGEAKYFNDIEGWKISGAEVKAKAPVDDDLPW